MIAPALVAYRQPLGILGSQALTGDNCGLSNECSGMEQQIFTSSQGEQVVILAPTGRLDITTAWQFRLKLQATISEEHPHVLVNLSAVNFIDSSGLTSLVAGMRDADKVGGSFRICNVHPEAKLVFEVTMMDSVFEIYETEEAALAVPYQTPVA